MAQATHGKESDFSNLCQRILERCHQQRWYGPDDNLVGVAKTGGTLVEISAFKTKLSQYCHQYKQYVKKTRSQRWHHCACGLGPVQRDLYSAFLLAHLEGEQTIPSVTQHVWESAEPRLRAVIEGLQQRANEGQHLPRSMGLSAPDKGAARARARRLKSPAYPHQEPVIPREQLEAAEEQQEPRCFSAGRFQFARSLKLGQLQ